MQRKDQISSITRWRKGNASHSQAQRLCAGQRNSLQNSSWRHLCWARKAKVHTKSVWLISFSGKSSRQHAVMSHKRNCIAVTSANRRHNETVNAIVGLHCHARGSSVDILTMQATWSWQYAAKGVTWANRKLEAEREGIFSCQTKQARQEKWCGIEHSTHHQACNGVSNRTWAGGVVHHGKRSSVHQNILGRNGVQTTINAVARTMRWRTQYVMAEFNQSAQKPWTCAFTGWGTENVRNSSEYIGDLVSWTMQIIGQNTTHQHITKEIGKNSRHRTRR